MVVVGCDVLCPGKPSRRGWGWAQDGVFMNVIASVSRWDCVPEVGGALDFISWLHLWGVGGPGEHLSWAVDKDPRRGSHWIAALSGCPPRHSQPSRSQCECISLSLLASRNHMGLGRDCSE